MKLKNKILPLLLLASTAGVYGRFRNHQLDPNKLYEVNLQSIFPVRFTKQ